MKCPKCNYTTFDSYHFCPKCNTDFSSVFKKLSIIFYELGPNNNYLVESGRVESKISEAVSDTSKNQVDKLENSETSLPDKSSSDKSTPSVDSSPNVIQPVVAPDSSKDNEESIDLVIEDTQVKLFLTSNLNKPATLEVSDDQSDDLNISSLLETSSPPPKATSSATPNISTDDQDDDSISLESILETNKRD